MYWQKEYNYQKTQFLKVVETLGTNPLFLPKLFLLPRNISISSVNLNCSYFSNHHATGEEAENSVTAPTYWLLTVWMRMLYLKCVSVAFMYKAKKKKTQTSVDLHKITWHYQNAVQCSFYEIILQRQVLPSSCATLPIKVTLLRSSGFLLNHFKYTQQASTLHHSTFYLR